MNAKYAGTCKLTGEAFDVGADITNDGGDWVLTKYADADGIRAWMKSQRAAAQLAAAGADDKMLAKEARVFTACEADVLRSWNPPATRRTVSIKHFVGYRESINVWLNRLSRN